MGNLIKVGLNYDTEIYYKLRDMAKEHEIPLALLIRLILKTWVEEHAEDKERHLH